MVRLVALSMLLLLAACSPRAAGQSDPVPTIPAASAPALPRDTPRIATPGSASPTIARANAPDLSLGYAGTARKASAISLNWRTEGGSIDAHGLPNFSRMEPLIAPVGATLTLVTSDASWPTTLEAQAHTLIGQEIQWGTPHPSSLPTRITAQETILILDRAPGECLLLVIVRWGDNQATYGFRVTVTP